MSNDGLSNDEIINILFKSYMNFTTTSDDKLFYEETLLANNNNILRSNILSDTPPQNPSFTEITSYEEVNTLLGDDFDIDSTWFDDKTEYGSFGSETTNVTLRLEKIKLDYLGSNSSAFVCYDNQNNNILTNLIPSNYSSQGYSLSLHYELNDVLKSVPWLATRSELAGSVAVGTSVDFGGALFDTKNGVVTFYDVNGEPSDVFTGKNFYLTATKYIGELGIDVTKTNDSNLSFDTDINMTSNLDVSNTVTAGFFVGDGSQLTNLPETLWHKEEDNDDISYVDGRVFIQNDVSLGSNLIVNGDIISDSSAVISNIIISNQSQLYNNISIGNPNEDVSDTTLNIYASSNGGDGIVYDGNMTIGKNNDITENNKRITIYGDLHIMNGGNIVIEDISNTTITELQTEVKVTDILNVTNEGTGPALTVNQIDSTNQDIVQFQDNSINVFTIGNEGQTTIYGSLDISGPVTASYFYGNGSLLTGIDGSQLTGITGSNITEPFELDVSMVINNTLDVSGNVSAINIVSTNIVSNNIESHDMSVNNFVVNTINANQINANEISANTLIGDGSNITNIVGTWDVSENNLSYSDGSVSINNDLFVDGEVILNSNVTNINGTITGNSFIGNGSQLTDLSGSSFNHDLILDVPVFMNNDVSINAPVLIDSSLTTNTLHINDTINVSNNTIITSNGNMDTITINTSNLNVTDNCTINDVSISNIQTETLQVTQSTSLNDAYIKNMILEGSLNLVELNVSGDTVLASANIDNLTVQNTTTLFNVSANVLNIDNSANIGSADISFLNVRNLATFQDISINNIITNTFETYDISVNNKGTFKSITLDNLEVNNIATFDSIHLNGDISTSTLSVNDSITCGNAINTNSLLVSQAAIIESTLNVYEDASFNSNVKTNSLNVVGNITASDISASNMTLDGTFSSNNLSINGAITSTEINTENIIASNKITTNDLEIQGSTTFFDLNTTGTITANSLDIQDSIIGNSLNIGTTIDTTIINTVDITSIGNGVFQELNSENLTINNSTTLSNVYADDITITGTLTTSTLQLDGSVQFTDLTSDVIVSNEINASNINSLKLNVTTVNSSNINNTGSIETNNITVANNALLYNSLNVVGAVTLQSTLNVQQEAIFSDILTVSKDASFNNNIDVSSLNVIHNITANDITVNDITANDITAKNLTLDGTIISNGLYVDNDVSLSNINSENIIVSNKLTTNDLEIQGTSIFIDIDASGLISSNTLYVNNAITSMSINSDSITTSNLNATGNTLLEDVSINSLNVVNFTQLTEATINDLSVNDFAYIKNANIDSLDISSLATISNANIDTLVVNSASTFVDIFTNRLDVSDSSTFTNIISNELTINTSATIASTITDSLTVYNSSSLEDVSASTLSISDSITTNRLTVIDSASIPTITSTSLNVNGTGTFTDIIVNQITIDGSSTITNLIADDLVVNNSTTLNDTTTSSLNVIGSITSNDLFVTNDASITTLTSDNLIVNKTGIFADVSSDIIKSINIETSSLDVDGVTTSDSIDTLTLNVINSTTLDYASINDLDIIGTLKTSNLDISGTVEFDNINVGDLSVFGNFSLLQLVTTNVNCQFLTSDNILNSNTVSTNNLNVTNAVTISDTLDVSGSATFHGGVNLYGKTTINDEFQSGDQFFSIGGVLDVDPGTGGAVTIYNPLYVSDVSINNNLHVGGDLSVNNNVIINGDISATRYFGDGSLLTGLNSTNLQIDAVDNPLTLGDTLNIGDSVTIGNTLFVDGSGTYNGNLEVDGALTILTNDEGSILHVGEIMNTEGPLALPYPFYDLEVSGILLLEGSLSVSEAATLNNTLFVEKDVSMNSNLQVNGDISAVRFFGDGSALTNVSTEVIWNKDENTNDISYGDGRVLIYNDASFSSHLNVRDLSVNNNVLIGSSLIVNNTLFVEKDVSINSNLQVNGDISAVRFFGDGSALTNVSTEVIWNKDENTNDISYGDGRVLIYNDASFSSHLNVRDLSVNNNVLIGSSLIVNNAVTFNDTLYIDNSFTVNDAVTLNDTLYVSNGIDLLGNITISGDILPSITNSFNLGSENYRFNTLFCKEGIFDASTIFIGDLALGSTTDGILTTTGGMSISGDLVVGGNVDISGQTKILGTLFVTDDVSFNSLLDVSYLNVNGNTNLLSELNVSGNTNLSSQLNVNGSTNLLSDVKIDGDVDVSGKLFVNDISVNGNIDVSGDISASYFIGNGSLLTGVLTEQLWSINNNDNISYTNGNVDISNLEVLSNSLLRNNIEIGNMNGDISSTTLNINASSNGGNGILYDGNFIINGNIQLTGGGSLIIEDNENTTITQLETESQVTETLTVTNLGTNTSLTVNQTLTAVHDIAQFQDNSNSVFVIGQNGNTTISGNLNVENKLDISNAVHVYEDLIVDGDLSLNGNISIGGTIQTSSSVASAINSSTVTSDEIVNSGAITTDELNSTTITNTDTISSNVMIANSVQFNETTVNTSDISGDIGEMRFNTTRNLFEYFSTESVWNSIVTYKGDQPPYLLTPQFTAFSQSILIQWSKFNSVYVDSFDGKVYPLSLQTFIDISFSDIDGTSTSGWKTIYIGEGSYDTGGNTTEHLESFTITSSTDTPYINNTSYSITFSGKPSTITLPSFTQNDIFDLRIYAINQSQTTPNYIYLYDVALKLSGPPGSVTVINDEDFLQNQFTIDLSYNLDSLDSAVTSGLDIAQYDISFIRIDSKSLSPVAHSGNLLIDWNGSTSLTKSDIDVTDLHPGAQYEISVRAQNTASLDSTTTTGYAYGDYGDTFSSSEFTNIGTNQYITSNDLNSVSSTGMNISLANNASIKCNINGTSSLANRIIMNSTGEINITGTSEFYVNYGLQGTDMTDSVDQTLVNVVISKYLDGATDSSITIPYTSVSDPTSVTSQSDSIAGYTFASSSSYNDEGDSNDYNKGFVYSSTIERTDSNADNTIFNSNFPPSIESYELNYVISSTSDNQSARINNSGNSSVSDTTSEFYVDDYNTVPTVIVTPLPSLTVSGTTFFGVPSATSIKLQATYTVANFASNIIPHNSSSFHSLVNAINDKNSYSFSQSGQTNISSTANYSYVYSQESTIGTSSYDEDTISDFVINVFYLDNESTPTLSSITKTSSISDVGTIFRDSSISYSGLSIYTFNGTNTIGSSISSSSSINNNTLLYFNGRFVSGGYSTTYDSTSVSPFSNWSSGYAVSGQNYSGFASTGTGGFKWIAFDVSSKQSGASLNLSNFKVNGSTPTLSNFGSTYVAYIYQHGNIGALNSVNNTGATTWFNQGNTTVSAAQSGNGASSDGINGVVNLSLSGDIYLIVGLPSSSTSYFTFS